MKVFESFCVTWKESFWFSPLLPVKKLWCTIIPIQVMPCFGIQHSAACPVLLQLRSWSTHCWRGAVGRSQPAGCGSRQGWVQGVWPLKVFFYAMPFPARQQGGLTGDYVSLPGYTESKQRVRQDHPLVFPSHPQLPLFPKLISLPLLLTLLQFPSSTVTLRDSDFISVDSSARVPSAPLGPVTFASFIYPAIHPSPFPCISCFFPSIKKYKCIHPKKLNKHPPPATHTSHLYSIRSVFAVCFQAT